MTRLADRRLPHRSLHHCLRQPVVANTNSKSVSRRISSNRGPTDISGLEFSTVQVDTDVESVYPHLDSGETAALVACTERDAILVTDDLDARNTADEEEIEVHGSVGVVLYGYSQGALSAGAAKQTLQELKQDRNLYLSTPLIEHAIELVESDDAGW